VEGRAEPDSHRHKPCLAGSTSADPTNWTLKDPTTGASITFENLTPGTLYVVQARAIGSAGPSDWSDPAVLMAV
jgi:hypothetical protein